MKRRAFKIQRDPLIDREQDMALILIAWYAWQRYNFRIWLQATKIGHWMQTCTNFPELDVRVLDRNRNGRPRPFFQNSCLVL